MFLHRIAMVMSVFASASACSSAGSTAPEGGAGTGGTQGQGNAGGAAGLSAGSGGQAGQATAGQGAGGEPLIEAPGPQTTKEEEPLSVQINASPQARVFAEEIPPGARWQEESRTLSFTPDFLQGGATYNATFTAIYDTRRETISFTIAVQDTIHPPAPAIIKTEQADGYSRLTVQQITDDYLDSPGYAGRTFNAVVIVPSQPPAGLPVRVGLHGFDGAPSTDGWSGEYRIFPHDPMNSYWWGYAEALPGETLPRG